MGSSGRCLLTPFSPSARSRMAIKTYRPQFSAASMCSNGFDFLITPTRSTHAASVGRAHTSTAAPASRMARCQRLGSATRLHMKSQAEPVSVTPDMLLARRTNTNAQLASRKSTRHAYRPLQCAVPPARRRVRARIGNPARAVPYI